MLVFKFFVVVILKLCTEFQFPSMPATGQKVCGGGGVVVVVVWWLRAILVFSLAQAEQNEAILYVTEAILDVTVAILSGTVAKLVVTEAILDIKLTPGVFALCSRT